MIKVILLTDVPRVGNRYQIKEVKEGFAQNVLIRKGLAELATPQALAKLNLQKEKIEKIRSSEDKIFSNLISQINDIKIVIKEKTNEKGHLFSAVSKKKIAEEIKNKTGLEIEENHLIIPEPIKEIGSYQIKIKKGNKEGSCEVVIEKI